VAVSEQLSAALRRAGIEHQLLNARQDEQEAELVARAGERGCVKVATSMAGRGTDILLGPGVLAAGGLHVIIAEAAPARRMDRQLSGRAGRQGNPGSVDVLLSMGDEVVSHYCSAAPAVLWKWLASADEVIASPWAGALVSLAQRSLERRGARGRRELWRLDRQLNDLLAFAGERE